MAGKKFRKRPAGIVYTPLVKKTLKICCAAHEGQVDKSGLPYLLHPVHLAEQMSTEEEICAALLHDTIEDTSLTPDDLRREGIPERVVQALLLLTHDPEVPYMDYVRKIRQNGIARKVKLADLKHNSDLSRLDTVTEKDRKRREKYLKAIEILSDKSGRRNT